jgi:hypothetical protein
MRCHLNGTRHPRKFPSFRNDRFVRGKRKFNNRHGGAKDAVLHDDLLVELARRRRALPELPTPLAYLAVSGSTPRFANGINNPKLKPFN